MNKIFTIVLHPKPEPEGVDTGLRFTDVLFGFVIRELFLRLQNWTHLDQTVKFHLIVGTTLVLGSWIGFRRSLYRSSYQLKFFNLPLFRFLVDQLMLILYFRVATLTPAPTEVGRIAPDAVDLVRSTTWLVMWVFVLYFAWDLLGIWLVNAKMKVDGAEKPRYSKVKDTLVTTEKQDPNWIGFWITTSSTAFLVVLWCFSNCLSSNMVFLLTAVLLVTYRWAKEIRTSCQPSPKK